MGYTAWDSGAYIGVKRGSDWRKGPGSRTRRRAKYLEGVRQGRASVAFMRTIRAGTKGKYPQYQQEPFTVASARRTRHTIKQSIRKHAAGMTGYQSYVNELEFRLGFARAAGVRRGPSTFRSVTKEMQGSPLRRGRNIGSFKGRQGQWKKGKGGRFVGSA